jgi:hypothetical protein
VREGERDRERETGREKTGSAITKVCPWRRVKFVHGERDRERETGKESEKQGGRERNREVGRETGTERETGRNRGGGGIKGAPFSYIFS